MSIFQLTWTPRSESSFAILSNLSRHAATMAASLSSLGWRMSRVNLVVCATVLTLPGSPRRMPVVTRPENSFATSFEETIIFAAASRESLRDVMGVVPAWPSLPLTSTSNHWQACAPRTTPTFCSSSSKMGPCSMCSSKCAAMGCASCDAGVSPRKPMRSSSCLTVRGEPLGGGVTSAQFHAVSSGIDPAQTPEAMVIMGNRAPSSL